MKKKLTALQVERLFEFTREHFVEHYDLQSELADHLANAIEARWEHNPEIDFDEALQAEFKKFGIFGFSDIIEKRQKTLTKKYYRLLWGYFKNFFRLPQVFGSITAILAFYKVIQLWPYVYIALLFGIMVFSIVKFFIMNKKYHSRIKRAKQRWLLEDIIFSCGGMGFLLYLPIQINIDFFDTMKANPLQSWLLAVFLVLLLLYQYTVLYILPSKAQKHLKETYPEYSISRIA